MLIISRSIEQYKDNQLLLNLQIFKQLFFKKSAPAVIARTQAKIKISKGVN